MNNSVSNKIYHYKNPIEIAKISIFMNYCHIAIISLAVLLHLKFMNNGVEIRYNPADFSDISFYVYFVSFYSLLPYYFWLYRTVKNALSFNSTAVTFTPASAIIWCFIPLANFFVPLVQMLSLWKVSHKQNNTNSSTLIVWCYWLISCFCSIYYLLPLVKDISDYCIYQNWIYVSVQIADIISLYLSIIIIKRISKLQVQASKPVQATTLAYF